MENVQSFKYLCTLFNENLTSEEIFLLIRTELKQRFYAFSNFGSFSLTIDQRHVILRALVLPVLLYNSEVNFILCTKK